MHRTTSWGARAALAALALAGAAACASKKPASADTPAVVTRDRGPDRGPGGRQMALFEGITLTTAQRASIDSIRAAYRDRMGPPPGDRRPDDGPPPGDRAERRQQMRQMMDEQRAAIRNVLTPEQQRIFDANVEKMRQRMEERRGERRG